MRMVLSVGLMLWVLPLPVSAQQQTSGAVPVGTAIAERKSISKEFDYVGRVDAVNRVQVTARVKGYLEEVLFKEGQIVKEGAPLYRIEQGLFQAAVEQAEGALERSKASKALTAIQLERAETLVKQQAGTVVARDQAKAADEQANGAMLTDKANLDTAKINLGYTDITSPIAGKIGKTNVTKGNVVGPESGELTLIVSQDPMYVAFPVSQRDLLQPEKTGRTGEIEHMKVRVRFSDGSTYDQVGTISFVNVTVDKSTDTVLVRATMPNPMGVLIDGQLVRVAVETAAPEEHVLIPQDALIADQEGVYVFVVADGKAAVRRVKSGRAAGTSVVIEDGLSGGEQVVVQGLQALRPGAAVRANPVQAPVGGN